MKTNTKKITKILILLLLVVVSGAIYLKYTLNKDIKYIMEVKESNFVSSEKISSIVGLKSKLENAKKVLDSFDILYIDKNNILFFIETVEKLAEKNNVVLVIDSVNVNEQTSGDISYGLLNMNLSLRGDYNNIYSFVSSLEKMPYFITINNLKLSKGETGGENNWAANLSMVGITN